MVHSFGRGFFVCPELEAAAAAGARDVAERERER